MNPAVNTEQQNVDLLALAGFDNNTVYHDEHEEIRHDMDEWSLC